MRAEGSMRPGASLRAPVPRLPVRNEREPLTRSEHDVAVLAGAGLRNSEIGTRLFITARTVECHLTRIYQKLGVRSRTELAIIIAPDVAPKASADRCWRCSAHLGPAISIA
jgi:DNA-binding NarL/FixJ family response regulator